MVTIMEIVTIIQQDYFHRFSQVEHYRRSSSIRQIRPFACDIHHLIEHREQLTEVLLQTMNMNILPYPYSPQNR